MNYWPAAQSKARLCWFVMIDNNNANDIYYMRKPISLDELVAKVNEMI